ncbi:hypothetical protein GQ55_6G182300 [Panicum hallii var. hallii]|uniref:F-box domain-containing protein n=1 Tax=Panicum hallii var. hallii TaxID=1504633 RepID=A0A2T7D738_9POAL|nr:hypothetical protein GQ55_6G182300 [Panicum hallii var. hallii]
MMPVDNEEDQIDDNFSSPCENEPMLSVDDAEDEPDAAAALWLPDVPIRNILARMPPSSATRFKVVSKSWRSMIADDSYAVLLHDGDAPRPVSVVDEARAARLAALHSCRGKPRHGFTVHNCCGTLACLHSGQRDAELLNPATGESLGLGHFFRRGRRTTWTHAADHLPWYCLGRCAGTGEYKVVHLDVRLPTSRRPHVTCEVLPLGRESWEGSSGRFAPEWKKVGLWHVKYCPADCGEHVAGVVCYLAWCVAGVIMVVSFDLSTHNVGEIDLPVAATEDGGVVASLSELDGRLCLSLVSNGAEAGRGDIGAALDMYVRSDDTDGGSKVWFQVCRPRILVKRADGSLCYYIIYMDGTGCEGAAAGEEVVYEHKGRRWRKQQLSGVTADVFVKSPLPLQAILRGA